MSRSAMLLLLVCLLQLFYGSSGGIAYQKQPRRTKYDYIVVGAGSTGSVVANRLSEDRTTKVLLLEAGGPPPDLSEVPIMALYVSNTSMEWNNFMEPQKNSCLARPENRCSWSRAKAFGGCSSHNSMAWVRGNKNDFDNWENLGAKGWNYSNVLPYFKKLENHQDPLLRLDEEYHGTTGYQTVSPVAYPTAIGDAFLEAGISLGFKHVDYNGASQLGISRLQVSQRDGHRCSTEKSYLQPADQRENLDILPYSFVLKVNFDDKKHAKSVIFDHDNQTKEILASREIILSAGALSSPKILMLSGIGPKEHLEQMKIPVIADVPGVGQELQDHIIISHMKYLMNDSAGIVFNQDVNRETEAQLKKGKGPMTSGCVEVTGFFNSKYEDKDNGWPELQLITEPTPAFLPWQIDFSNVNASGMFVWLLRPKSRGVLKLRSANPYVDPSVDPRYFTDEDDDDIKRTIDGVKVCLDIIASPIVQRYGLTPFTDVLPGCENYTVDSDEYIECAIRRFATGGFHLAGTCKMGDPEDPKTVVDPELRVKEVTGLRVADASIMPLITSGNLNAPCIMIGEKAADMIKASFQASQV